MQQQIGDRLARGLLSGDIVDGDTVRVDVDPGIDSDGLVVTAERG